MYNQLLDTLYILPILLFSIVVHELAHGWMALRLGDPTARDMGRLTLNPLPHIDPVGSVLVPLFSLLAAGRVFIAWAKPVPVNPMNFSNYRRDDILVSVVGPLSNLFMALGCTIAFILLRSVNPTAPVDGSDIRDLSGFLLNMFLGGIRLNVGLAVFNMIPVPPLDGSHVLASFLPPAAGERYRSIGFVGIFILLFLMRWPPFNEVLGQVMHLVLLPYAILIRLFA